MRRSDEIYIAILQNFANYLAFEDKIDLHNETSMQKLEMFILENKHKMPEKSFYFVAGASQAHTYEEFVREGLNPSDEDFEIALTDFEYLIEIKTEA